MILIKSKPGFKNVHKTLTKLNKKKSSGTNGLSEEQLILWADSLCDPLTAIVKKSFEIPSTMERSIKGPLGN